MSRKKTEGEVLDEVTAAQVASKPSEREREIVDSWNRLESARAFLKAERKDTKTMVDASRATVAEAIQKGTAVGDTHGQIAKLRLVENEWQNHEEVRAEKIERIKGARDLVEASLKRLRDAIEHSSQLSLFEKAEEDGRAAKLSELEESERDYEPIDDPDDDD